MPSTTSRHSRRWHFARRTQASRRMPDPLGTPHQRAIRRLALEVAAREGLWGWFHAGVTWRSRGSLVDPKISVVVHTEQALKLGRRRYVPDLVVRCAKSDQILLVVEVWHTHAVSARKKAAFNSAGFPWIEVRSWHVISRFRKRPLPVLDWGGPGLPAGPEQYALFAAEPAIVGKPTSRAQTSIVQTTNTYATGYRTIASLPCNAGVHAS